MLDFLVILGQAASVLLLIYGAILVLLPARKPAAQTASEMDLLHA